MADQKRHSQGGLLGWVERRQEDIERGREWLEEGDDAKRLVGTGVRYLSRAPGLLRGALRNAQNTVAAAPQVIEYIEDPSKRFTDPRSPARREVAAVAGYVRNPAEAEKKARDRLAGIRGKVDPKATPMAPTLGGEVERNVQLGMNQGQAIGDLLALLPTGAALKGMGRFPRQRPVLTEAELIAKGRTPAQAARLTSPYEGEGDHWIQRKDLKWAPKWLQDVPFNVYNPPGLTFQEFYSRHYMLDPRFHGARLPGARRGQGWSGQREGLQKFGPLDRFIYGMPGPTRALVVQNSAGGMAPLIDEDEDEDD